MILDERNWAGNYRYSAARLHCPQSVAEVQELAAGCDKLKALGTRHSFSTIADTTADLVDVTHLNQVVELNAANRRVTVEAGIRYGALAQYLHANGFALHNLASLPHISVGGACATGTHGSGVGNGSLATAARGLELITADGSVRTFSREQDDQAFAGMPVHLGALGIVTKLTLDIVPAFAIRQDVYENLPFARLEDNFEAILSGAYSVSLFTDWQTANFNQVWLKSRVEAGAEQGAAAPEFYGAIRADRPLHPIAGVSAENCTAQMGVAGAWHERLPHFRLEFTPSRGDELQSEYLVPRQQAIVALRAVFELRERIADLLLISEIRTVAADDLWLSPSYGADCVALHFTWQKDWPGVADLLPVLEAALAPFHARPHWGKLFTTPAARLHSLYPKLPDFQQLCRTLDPAGKFRNAFLDATLFGAR